MLVPTSDDDRTPCICPIMLVQLISTAGDDTSLVLHSVWTLLIWFGRTWTSAIEVGSYANLIESPVIITYLVGIP